MIAAILTVTQILNLPSASSPQIAPDGSAVVYSISRELWRVPAKSGEPKRIGAGSNARWSPDGKRLAYIASSRVHIDGKPVSDEGVQAFEWSPDGMSIAYVASSSLPKDDADFHVVGEEKRAAVRLFVQRIGGKAIALTDEALSIDAFAWSPDGTLIAFGAASADADEAWRKSDLYVVNVADKSVKQLTQREGFDSAPFWSPDGNKIAYVTSNVALGQTFSSAANSYLAIVDRDGSNDRVVTRDFDERPSPVAWIGGDIYFQARARTDEQLYRLDATNGRITRVTTPGVFRDFSITADGKSAAFIVARSGALPEIAIAELAAFAPRIITNVSAALRDVVVSSREVIAWTASDGTPIEGVLVKPADFDPAKRYPLLVVLHTGPIRTAQPVLESELPYPVEIFAARGALVLEPNYRGSAGYGERFRKLLIGQLGAPEVDDVITGVDALIAKGIVDPKRVGAMGWSHGGYLAAMIATSTDRFAAVSAGAGVSDWQTYYTQSDGGPWAAEYHNGTPWDVPEAFRASAPLTYVKKARTPTLIQHGERDPRAPIASSYELRRALLDQGVRVKMIVYDKAGHAGGGFTPNQLREVMEHNLEWFEPLLGHH
jgi:dipeptidyl aminopeptidase/acylaminoacyl peptidase